MRPLDLNTHRPAFYDLDRRAPLKLDFDLVHFTCATVHNKQDLIVKLLPCEKLGGRVRERGIAQRIIDEMDLGVPPMQTQCSAKLRDASLSLTSGDVELIVGNVGTGVVGVADDVEG